MNNKKLWMFDLDGTLIDSIGGIARSVNVTRGQYGFPPLEKERIRSYTGDGIRKLTERSFADVGLPEPVEVILTKMTANYAADPVYDTHLYEGVKETLATLSRKGVLLAVISNKPEVVGEKILARLEVRSFFCENIGGGGRFPLKPAPDAVFFLLEKYGAAKEDAMMVGDNHTDLNCAEAAGVKSIFCRFGFGRKDDAKATFEAEKFSDILSFR